MVKGNRIMCKWCNNSLSYIIKEFKGKKFVYCERCQSKIGEVVD